jgi:ribosomal protein L44E
MRRNKKRDEEVPPPLPDRVFVEWRCPFCEYVIAFSTEDAPERKSRASEWLDRRKARHQDGHG